MARLVMFKKKIQQSHSGGSSLKPILCFPLIQLPSYIFWVKQYPIWQLRMTIRVSKCRKHQIMSIILYPFAFYLKVGNCLCGDHFVIVHSTSPTGQCPYKIKTQNIAISTLAATFYVSCSQKSISEMLHNRVMSTQISLISNKNQDWRVCEVPFPNCWYCRPTVVINIHDVSQKICDELIFLSMSSLFNDQHFPKCVQKTFLQF